MRVLSRVAVVPCALILAGVSAARVHAASDACQMTAAAMLEALRPNFVLKEMPGDRSINCARVDIDKTELPRKFPRNAAFSRSSGTINGDHTLVRSV